MIRLERGRAQGAVGFPEFSPYGAFDAIRSGQNQRRLVTIGDQTYEEIDNGRANVLAPVDLLFTPEQRAAQREGVARAVFMAGHPLGTVAYGTATLAGAPQKTRDAVLVGGGLVEEAASGRAPRIARGRAPSPQVQSPRAPVRQWELNETGQATGFNASMTKDQLSGGTRAKQSIRPPGFQDGDSRGHLRAKQLGGSGDDERNLVTITQWPTNSPYMSRFEGDVARRVRAGEAVEYMVKPLYRAGSLPPSEILLTATGPRQAPRALVVRNPAGYRP